MKKWKILSESRIKPFDFAQGKNRELKMEEIINLLLQNRGITSKKEREEFLNPCLEDVTIESVSIDKKQLKKTIQRIKKAIEQKEQIVVFGDYDVDGICGCAILWETLYSMKALVVPYIPHRVDEGYGLSLAGISNVQSQISNIKLVITVDNGIVAHEAVEFANKNNIDVIITDHHVADAKLPDAYSFIHTTKLCGAGVAYLLAQELKARHSDQASPEKNPKKQRKRSFASAQDDKEKDEHNHIELVALATIADLVPLTGANRALTKFGLEQLCNTKRVGLLELFKEALLNISNITPYHVGHIIAPRLNAMGRLEYAMDSLRLLCTKDSNRAMNLAQTLGMTNRDRQTLTFETVQHAVSGVRTIVENKKLLFIAHESYQQGVIGLVAGRLVEEFYRPAIVLSIGEEYSKASARSVAGFNIIEFIRSASSLLVNAGGHPMAAGFTIETSKIELLQKALEEKAEELISEDMLTRSLRIDCEIPLEIVSESLYSSIQKLSPFGMGNPEPVFASRNVVVEDMRIIGKDGKHLKMKFKPSNYSSSESREAGRIEKSFDKLKTKEFSKSSNNIKIFDAVAFGLSEKAKEIHRGDSVDIVYTIDMNEWNGNRTLQLKIKDMKLAGNPGLST